MKIQGRLPFFFRWLICLIWCLLIFAREAGATQVHASPEGLYAHQIGHILFSFSMGLLIYWLRARHLVRDAGWRFIQYSAIFFILWNVDAMAVHYLDERDDIFETIDAGTWHGHVHLAHGPREWALLYYLAKMDHLLSLPAIIFLYLGLRRLLDQARETQPREPAP